MDRTFWHKQTAKTPLFPDILWSKPENKRHAGKLLVAGGSGHGFAAVAEAYGQAQQSGIGSARVLLPDSLQKVVGKFFDSGEYAPSTPSGSFSKTSLSDMLDLAAWSDGVLLAGEFGRNSETAVLLESFITKYSGQLSLCGDAIDNFSASPSRLLQRPNTLIAPNFNQLQKLAVGAQFPRAFTSRMEFMQFGDLLHEFSLVYPINLVVRHTEHYFVSVGGEISTTNQLQLTTYQAAAAATVWWLQNPNKTFAALTTSLVDKKV